MDELAAINGELALIKRQFEQRHALLELRLNKAHQLKEQTQVETKSKPERKPKPKATSRSSFHSEVKSEVKKQPEFCGPVKPGFVALQLIKLTALLMSVVAIFVSWAAPFTALYQHFKARNMLAVMWLMVCGVTFTVAGFGYLLQLVVVQSLPEMKVLGMALIAAAVVYLGIGLKRKTRFSEFSSSIIALGLILGFSCIYFAGSVYQLMSQLWVLSAYVVMVMVSHFIASRYQCSWLCALGIIGIALLPMLNPAEDLIFELNSHWYLFALLLVSTSNLYMALKYMLLERFGLWLAVVTLGCVLAAFELLLAQGQTFAYLIACGAFYALFFGYVVVLAKFKLAKVQPLLVFLFTVVASFIALVLQLNQLVNVERILVANLLMALLAGFYLRHLLVGKHKLVVESMLIVAAIWAVGLAMTLFEQGYWGLVWALEGLSLLWLGNKLATNIVFNKGQLLVVLGLAYSLIGIAPFYPAPALITFDGIGLAFACVAITAIWLRMIKGDLYPKLQVTLAALEVLLVCLQVIGLVEAWVGPYSALAVLVLQVGCLWRAKSLNCAVLEYLALSMMLVPLQAIVAGANQVSSWYVADMPMFAQLAALVLVAQCWGLALYYRRYYPEGCNKGIAELLRSLVYLLLPVCWLPEAIRSFDVDVVAVLWASPLLAFYVSKRFSQYFSLYVVQFYVSLLVIVTAIAFIVLIFSASVQAALMAIVGFAGFYLWCFYLEHKHQRLLAQCFASIGYFGWGIAVVTFISICCDSMLFSLLFAAVYWGIGLFESKMLPLFMRNHRLIVAMNGLVYGASWMLSLFERQHSVVPVVGLLLAGVFSYCHRGTHYRLPFLTSVNGQLGLHAFIVISYCCFFIGGLAPDWSLLIAPALVVHGVVMLFILPKLKSCLKASLFIMGLGVAKLLLVDANITLMMHKVMLFMGLGIFVLTASFVYQRLLGKVQSETDRLGAQ